MRNDIFEQVLILFLTTEFWKEHDNKNSPNIFKIEHWLKAPPQCGNQSDSKLCPR
jgi:hypothetical protein